jgi:hypothetical protein
MRDTLTNCTLEEFVWNQTLFLTEKREIQLGLLRCIGVSRREAMVLMHLTEWSILPLENELIRRGVLIDGTIEQREIRDGEAEDGQDRQHGGRTQRDDHEIEDGAADTWASGGWREQPVIGC